MKTFYPPLGRCRAVARSCAAIVLSCLCFSSRLSAQSILSTQTISATIASGGDTQPIASVVDASGNIYQVGVLRATADLDPGTGVSYVISNGQEDCFLAKYSSAGAFLWGRSWGSGGQDLPSNVAIDNSGNIIVSGYFSNTVDFDPGVGVTKLTSNGNYDIFFSKFTPSGDFVFAKSMGGNTNDMANSMGLDASGNIYLTGMLSSDAADFDPGPGVATLTRKGAIDCYVAKYDNDGNYQFAFNMGAPTGSTQIYSNKIKVVSNALYITGYLYGAATDFDPGPGVSNLSQVSASTATDIFLAKYDLSGNYTWGFVVGGTGTDIAYGLDTDASGNVYLTGSFENTVDFNPATAVANQASAGYSDIFLAKYTAAGVYSWAVRMGNNTGGEVAQALKVDAAGNAIIGGYFSGTVDFNPAAATNNLVSAGSADGFIAKYTTAGVYSWAVKVGGTSYDRVGAFATDASNNVYVNGSFSGTVDLNPGAATLNVTAPGTQTIGYHLKLTSAGAYSASFVHNIPLNASSNNMVNATWIDASNNYYVIGYFSRTVDFDPGTGVTSLTSTGYVDCYIAKYNAAGQLLFARRIGNTSSTQGKGIATDAAGNIYVTGSFSGTVDLDPGTGTANRTATGSSDDIFLLKLNSSGNYVNAVIFGGTSYDVISAMTIDNAGAVYLTGTFYGTVDFDPGTGVANRSAAGSGSDIFVAKYNSNLGYVFASVMGGTDNETPSSIAVDASGNVYSAGNVWGTMDADPGAGVVSLVTAGIADIYVSKLDANGNYANAFRLGSTGNDNAGALAVDADGNLYVAGHFMNTVDFDPGTGVEALTSAGTLDGFVAKYDAAGNYVNARSFGGSLNDMVTKLKLDARGNVYVAGQFWSVDWSMGPGAAIFPNEGNADVFLLVFDRSLRYNGGRAIGGGQNDQPGSIAFDDADNIYLAGSFMSVANVDNLSGAAAYPFRSISGSDIYLAQFSMMTMLPIKLESFTAVQQPSQVVTRWTVSSQVNNDYFTLERSADGSQFTALGRIAGCVDCQTRMDYQFIDKQPLTGWSYYRLKQTDLDGRSSYSQIVRVNYSATNGQLAVYPTVTDNAYTLSYNNTSNKNQSGTIRVINTAGTVVHQVKVVLKPGRNTVSMTLAKLGSGIYYTSLFISNTSSVQTATVIKQR
ncbi:SBBP repeat-containing protein [Paraflavitalea pollutisoli]|uniref:SBBP repeat-containing protein n=1 Tax=Paraflavitalea pollutisoli TaxID=3034143 RepID=UPI0023ED609D|nr:SBBP repeat-containing protein [Paraflavitalea sp. H1-2-19X]